MSFYEAICHCDKLIKSARQRTQFLHYVNVAFSITLVSRSPRESINYFIRRRWFSRIGSSQGDEPNRSWLTTSSCAACSDTRPPPPIRSLLMIPRLIGPYVIMRRATHVRRHASFLLGVSWSVPLSHFLLRVNLPVSFEARMQMYIMVYRFILHSFIYELSKFEIFCLMRIKVIC